MKNRLKKKLANPERMMKNQMKRELAREEKMRDRAFFEWFVASFNNPSVKWVLVY